MNLRYSFRAPVRFALWCCFVVALIVPAAAAQAQSLTVEWDPSASPDVTGYYVYVGTSPGTYDVLSQAPVLAPQTSYTVPVLPGVRYYFAVSAFSAGGVESALTPEIIGGVPTLARPANQSGQVGTAATLTLGGVSPTGTAQYGATGLPPGLTLNTSTGVISGTPTTAGTYTVTVSLSDPITTVQQSFTWTIAPAQAVVGTVSASPASGSGAQQTFSLTYSDSLGAFDISTAQVLFSATANGVSANTCMLTYNRGANVLSLLDNAGTSWSSGLLGDATTLQNSQCSVSLASSSASASGKNLTLSVAMAFKAAYGGTKNLYMYAASNGGQNSGWVDRGDWQIPSVAISNVAVSPASGSGQTQTFALQYADTLGATDLKTTWVWFNATLASTSANSCIAYYERATSKIFLLNDAGTNWASATAGTSATLQNSQCAINVGGSSAALSGTTLTLNVAVTFTSAFAGAKNIYLFAAGNGGGQSGWQDLGDWTVTSAALAPPPVLSAVSVSPATGTGATQTFALQYSDTAGATDLTTAWAWFNANMASTSANSCLAHYDRASNRVLLLNDAGVTWSAAVLGTSATLQNSQCSVNVATSSATLSGNTLTVNLAMTFKSGFGGAKNVYLFAFNGTVSSGWQDRGDWTVPGTASTTTATVTADSVTPASGSSATQTFALKYTDTAGVPDIVSGWVWFNSTLASSSANSCLAYYERATNRVFLQNDAATGWSGGTVGSGASLQNGQCSISLGTATTSSTGNTLTVNLPVTFNSAYAGAKNVYLFAAGSSVWSGWQDRGDWTVPVTVSSAPTVTVDSVTPSAGSGTSATFVMKASSTAGTADLKTMWLWLNATITSTAANSCIAYYDVATDSVLLLDDSGTQWSSAKRGTLASLQNSRCSVSAVSVTVAKAGNTMTVAIPVSFKPLAAGARNIYLFAAGNSSNSGWQDRGDWTAR